MISKNHIRISFIFLFVFFHVSVSIGKDYDQTKERLTILLKERTEKFSKYTESIDKRSGIFGNQTKKDLRKVNEVLIEITQTDNVIFKELKRLLDYKNYEKANVMQDLGKYEQDRERCLSAIDTLNKQLTVLKMKNMDLEQDESSAGFFAWVFGVLFFIMLWLYWKAQSQKRPAYKN